MRRQTLQRLGMLLVALLAWSGVASAQSWLPAPKPLPPLSDFNAGSIALQLTDGTIMVQQNASSNWWKLTPDKHADYTTGTWSQLAPSQWYTIGVLVNYAPTFFASAVLPDGRVIVMGGEYLAGTTGQADTTLGAIFDPTKGPIGSAGPIGTWTPVKAPNGWGRIGDAASVVLPNGILPGGTFMLANCCDNPPQAALLVDADTSTWKVLTTTSGYKGKYDENNEEGWTLLPDGNVLTVDTYQAAPGKGVEGAKRTLPNNSEIYNPGSGTWTSAGNTIQPLSDLQVICDPPLKGGHEVGPAVLRPDGTVFATGVNTCKSLGAFAGHTAIYHTQGGFWTAGPDIPCEVEDGTKVCNDMADAPAALLQDGNVLVQTSPGINKGPSRFYEFDFKTNKFLKGIPAPPNFSGGSSETGRMLVVSSGHVFYMHVGSPTDQMGFYENVGTYEVAWAPLVEAVGPNLVRGQTYTISGTQFNGLSQGSAYGDDAQSATNYPLVLIENCAKGTKSFARTHDFPTGVATGFFNVVTTKFDVSPNTDLGPSNLIVIANGIPSQPAGGPGCLVNIQAAGN